MDIITIDGLGSDTGIELTPVGDIPLTAIHLLLEVTRWRDGTPGPDREASARTAILTWLGEKD